MTPTDTYKKSVEKFGNLTIENKEIGTVSNTNISMEYILKSHTIALLEGMIAELEGEKWVPNPNKRLKDKDAIALDSHNQALQDQINRLQAEVDVIKSL